MSKLLSSGPSGWKKWGIMKLREKCNFLGLDDTGKRDATVRTLRSYYSNLSKRISDSDNPWVCDNVDHLVGETYCESSIMKWTLMDTWSQSSMDNIHPATSPSSTPPSTPPSSPSSTTSTSSTSSNITDPAFSPITPMQPPRQPSMQLTSAPISFTPKPRLSGILNDIPFDTISNTTHTSINPQCTWQPSQSMNKRPTICYNDKYVDTMLSPKTVPGPRSYAQVADPVRVTSIVGDSTIRSVNQRFFNQFLDQSKQRARIYKYPGATADMVKHYIQYTLEHEKPHQTIICAGTNDILYERELANPATIANRIADIARACKLQGVEYVNICSLMPMCSYRYRDIFIAVNTILKTICQEEGFIYIAHNNMYSRADLHWDRLHLNINGTNKYIGNLLSHMESYNPYLYPEPPYHSKQYY